jgi:hypothetical protein
MAEIGQLPPAYRVPPSRPATGSGQDKGAPQRKPRDAEQRREHPPRRKDGGDVSHIDEYA